MVPYQYPTDTCPDCSDIPCDCGLPAGYKLDTRFAGNFAPHIKVVDVNGVLELINQRDKLDDQLDEILIRLGRTQEKMFDAERQRDAARKIATEYRNAFNEAFHDDYSSILNQLPWENNQPTEP